jgi:hypothetical protein
LLCLICQKSLRIIGTDGRDHRQNRYYV